MAITVEGYTRRVGNKSVRVGGYTRSGVAASGLLDRVTDKKKAQQIAEKYKEFPNTLHLMLDTKWGDVAVTRYRSENGKRVPYQTTRRMPMLDEKQWGGLVKENMRAVNGLINRFYNYGDEIKDDLKAEGRRAILEAAANYEAKYNPKDPADWYKHLYTYARGFMQAELNRQISKTVVMPSHKLRLLGEFKELWYRHHGDWDKIATDMDLRKKDLYPDMKGPDGEEPLPMDGYVSVAKKEAGTLERKMEVHEKRVNDIQDGYMRSLSRLSDRKAYDNPNAKKEFDAYLLDYDRQIADYKKRLKEADGDKKKSLQQKVTDLESSKSLYAQSFAPIVSEADYDAEKRILDNVRQAELRDAKRKLDADLDKSTVTGVRDLFKEFEAMMDMTEVNLSGDYTNSEGGAMNMDDLVAVDDIDSSDNITVREEYKQYVERFLSDINTLDKRTATVLKMSLGLHEKNELQSHGLWGTPMTPTEIVAALPKGTYPVEGSTTDDAKLKAWKESEPTKTIKVKKSEAEFGAEQKDYDKRLKATEAKITAILPKLKQKYGPNDVKKMVDQMRTNAKVGHHGSVDYRPRKFKEEKVPTAKYNEAIEKWKASKPTAGRQRTAEDRVRRDIEMGTSALRRIADPKNVANMMNAVRIMRHYGIDRPELKAGLQKAYEDVFGIRFVSQQEADIAMAENIKKAVSAPDGATLVAAIQGAAAKFFGKLKQWFPKPEEATQQRYAILANGEDMDGTDQWQLVSTEHPFAEVAKGEIFTVKDLADEVSKAEGGQPTGNTWSAQLQRKNWPSRWVTMRGSKVLLKIMNSGTKNEHGIVVFAGNSKLEHMKVIPKTHEEYSDIKDDAEKKNEQRKERKAPEATDDRAKKKVVEKDKSKAKKEVQETHGTEVTKRIKTGDVKGMTPDDFKKAVDNLSPKEKQTFTSKLTEKANTKIVNGTLSDILGSGYKDVYGGLDPLALEPVMETKTGVKAVDDLLDAVDISDDTAIGVLGAESTKREANKAIDDFYRNALARPKENVELTTLSGIMPVEWDKEPSKAEIIDKALEKELTKIRAQLNSDFYNLVQSEESGSDKMNTNDFARHFDRGAVDAMNVLGDLYMDGNTLPREIVELIGPQNAARITAMAMVDKHGKEKIEEELGGIMETRAIQTVMDTLGSVDERMRKIEAYTAQREDGIMRGQTISAHVARQHKDVAKDLGATVGNLQTVATVLDSVRDLEASKGDVVVDGGTSVRKLKNTLHRIGLMDSDYKIEKVGDRLRLTIPEEGFAGLLNKKLAGAERDQTVADIKAGKLYDKEWLPEGTRKHNYDVLDKKALDAKIAEWKANGEDAKAEGWEKFTNKEGELGYQHTEKKGVELYRKQGKTEISAAPQKGIQFALAQKRFLGNLGAGTGKTVMFLGTVQHLKATGKLKTFAFHSMPSRLRNEFFKDRDKFFPDLKVLELDKVTGGAANKRKALADAAAGKYDMVISGHDSMKRTGSSFEVIKELGDRLNAHWEEHGDKTASKREQRAQRLQMKVDNEEAWKKEAEQNRDLPSVIKSFNPTMVTIDEAHEAIQDVDAKAQTQRQRALRILADGTEYFIPATGTVVKNNIGELANILNMVSPDSITDPVAFGKQWENVNQGANVFGDLAHDAFRRQFDNIMLTEHLKIDGAKLNTHTGDRLKPTDVQNKRLKEAEDIYYNEKKLKGYAIMDSDTYELKKNGDEVALQDFNGKVMDDKGRPTKQALAHLAKSGHDPEKFQLVTLGTDGAASRRKSRYAKTLANGDWKTNVKFQRLGESIGEIAAQGRKQIVTTNRKDSVDTTLAMLKEKHGWDEGKEVMRITGDVKEKDRARIVREFNRNPDAKVLVMNQAGMTGLNLQSATAMHSVEKPSSHYMYQQGVARAYRRGQTNDVDVYHYDTDTIHDDRTNEILAQKKKYAEAVDESPDKRRNMAEEIAKFRSQQYERLKSKVQKAMPSLYVRL